MRSHKAAGIVCAIFGVMGIVGGSLMLGVMAYYNAKYGPIEFSDGEYNALDQIALTWQNVTRGVCSLLGGISGLAAAVSWFKQRKQYGVIFSVLLFSLAVAAAALQPHN